jgi:hypothetical protein
MNGWNIFQARVVDSEVGMEMVREIKQGGWKG